MTLLESYLLEKGRQEENRRDSALEAANKLAESNLAIAAPIRYLADKLSSK